VNDAPFNANAPIFLDPGASSGPFELFDVIVDPSAAPAAYSGNLFSIFGGPDGGTFTISPISSTFLSR
jgi:hypothetical protein